MSKKVEIIVYTMRPSNIEHLCFNFVNTLDCLGLAGHIFRWSKFPMQCIFEIGNVLIRFMTYEKFDWNYRDGFRGIVMSDREFEEKLDEYYKTHKELSQDG